VIVKAGLSKMAEEYDLAIVSCDNFIAYSVYKQLYLRQILHDKGMGESWSGQVHSMLWGDKY
jgi:hypothetical protein